MSAQPKKLFKYYLEKNIKYESERPLFFRRVNRWRMDPREYVVPISKFGYLKGYCKYGVGAYIVYYYTWNLFHKATHGGHHGHDEHHDSHSEGHGAHGAHAEGHH